MKDRIDAWSLEARARYARDAALRRDAERLWALTEAYLRRDDPQRSRPSRHTARAYRRGIEELLALWPDGDLLSASADDVGRYVERLTTGERGPILTEDREGRRGRRPTRGPLSPATIALRVAAARSMFAALRWAGATDGDPFAEARPRSTAADDDVAARAYSEYQLVDLLGHARDDDERLVLLLGAHAGLRVSEMLALRWDHLDLAGSSLTVPGTDACVALSRPLRAALVEAELRARRDDRARPSVLRLRSQYGVYRRLRRLCERAEVRFKGVRGLRHLAAARIVRSGGDLEHVQHALRLGGRDAARRYSHLRRSHERGEGG